MTAPVKAWRTSLWGIVSIVLAESRAKAKAATVRGANAAGFYATMVSKVSVVRAKEFDAIELPVGRCASVSFAATAARRAEGR